MVACRAIGRQRARVPRAPAAGAKPGAVPSARSPQLAGARVDPDAFRGADQGANRGWSWSTPGAAGGRV